MRPSTVLLCLRALRIAFASDHTESTSAVSERQVVTEESALASSDDKQNHIEIRAQIQPDATTAVTQAPVVTTLWMQTQISSSITYVEVVYTQTLAAVPGQWPLPVRGEIGYGTLQKDKRDAEPTPQADASATSFVLELQTLVHTVAVTPVFQITELTEITVDANGNMSNASLPVDVSSATIRASET